MAVPFTQYMRPHGHKMQVYIDLPEEIEAMAKEINNAGFRFEVEMLTTGDVSATISDNNGDYEFNIGPNDARVPERMSDLIRSGYRRLDEIKARRKELEDADAD